jgi:hypothetical protein
MVQQRGTHAQGNHAISAMQRVNEHILQDRGSDVGARPRALNEFYLTDERSHFQAAVGPETAVLKVTAAKLELFKDVAATSKESRLVWIFVECFVLEHAIGHMDTIGSLTTGCSVIAGKSELGVVHDPLSRDRRPGDHAGFGAISILFRVATVPNLPGDFNHDRSVDAADYIEWRKMAARLKNTTRGEPALASRAVATVALVGQPCQNPIRL